MPMLQQVLNHVLEALSAGDSKFPTSSESSEMEEEEEDMTYTPPPTIQGHLNYDLYALIIDHAISSLSSNDLDPLDPLRQAYTPNQAVANRFLKSCCLVNSSFESIARRRLYASTKYNAMTLRRALKSSPRLASYVKRFSLDARIIITKPHEYPVVDPEGAETEEEALTYLPWDRNSADLLTSFPILPNLERLSICESTYAGVDYLHPSPLYKFHYPASRLTHLEYNNGTALLLARLISHLPHLNTLHLGRTNVSSSASTPTQNHGGNGTTGGGHGVAMTVPLIDQLGGEARVDQPVCKLRELTFQSISHFCNNAADLEFLFASSIDFLETLKLGNCSTNLLRDLLPVVSKARTLEMTVKERRTLMFVEDVALEDLLKEMRDLERVALHVRDDYIPIWPGAEQRALVDKFPKVAFTFHQGEVSFA